MTHLLFISSNKKLLWQQLFYDFYLTIWIGMLKSHLSTFWNFNLNSKKKLKWGVWNLKEVLNQNGTRLLAIRKWEHSNGSEMSCTSVEPKRKSSNREIQCLFQCANFLVPHIPLHSLRLEFLHFSDQTLLILEASFHLKNKSGNVITKKGFINKIIYTEWVQIDLCKREKIVKKITRLFNFAVDGTHDQSLTKEPWIFAWLDTRETSATWMKALFVPQLSYALENFVSK